MKDINYKYLLITLAVVLIAFLSCSLLWLYPDKGVGPNMMTAFLGVFLSALVTLLLLRGQTKAEESKDRNSQVFKEKLRIYQDFLETLNVVLEDGVVTPEEALKLKFKISLMALHTDGLRINEISRSIKKIFIAVNERPGKLKIESVQLEDLLHIVDQFSEEIYGTSKANLEVAIENFKVIDESYGNSQPSLDNRHETNPENVNVASNRDELIQQLEQSGWVFSDDAAHPIMFKKQDITVKLERDNNWYFSITLAKIKYDSLSRRNVYLALRQKFGGWFSTNADYGWYNYLKEEYCSLLPQELDEAMTANAEFRQYLYGCLMQFAHYMNNVIELLALMPKLSGKDDERWETYPYLGEREFCVASQFKHDSKPFIDLVPGQDGGSYRVEMGVRNVDDSDDFISRMGMQSPEFDNEIGHLIEHYESKAEAIERVNTLMARIEQAYCEK
ncbi:MAG: hypothetical protein J5980_07500 [Muribaculaceae bacterium]|nr:hypothetical protein [Muribaculaceae bacterium]